MDHEAKRVAHFHSDPLTTTVAECTDNECDKNEGHYSLEVVGEDKTIDFVCAHMMHRVVFYELTPADHVFPVCPEGCSLTVTRVA